MFVIAGVSGRSGSAAAGALLGAGRPVRVLVRDPARGEPWRARGAEVAVASLADEAGLTGALAGAEAAYLLSPQDPRSSDPISDGWRIADAFARAVDRSRLPHLVLLSSRGAELADGTGITRTLHAAEERLASSAAATTFLRASFLLDNLAPAAGAAAGGALPTFFDPDRAMPMIAARDVGVIAARALLERPPASRREVIELLGPREYSPRDLAAALGALLGRPVEPEQLPLEAVVPFFTSMGATAAFAEQIRQLFEALAAGRLDGAGGRVVRGTTDASAFFASLLLPPTAPFTLAATRA